MSPQHGEIIGDGLDRETFLAWGKLVFGAWGPERTPPDPKEIARILRLRRPLPPFVQDWLADLIDPPSDGYEEVKFVLKRNGRAARKCETAYEEYQKALALRTAMKRGKNVTEAIAEVMPGKQRQGFRLWKSAQGIMEFIDQHPEYIEGILKLATITDKK